MSRFFIAVLCCLFLTGCKESATGVPSDHSILEMPERLPEPPPQYYFDNESQRSERIQKFIDDHPEWNEKHKIHFLIDGLRLSHLKFIRNGSVYDGMHAARWFRWKMRHRQFRSNPILTSRDFIERVAKKSNTTGLPYQVILKNSQIIDLLVVLEQELFALEEALIDSALGRAIKEHSIAESHLSEESASAQVLLPPPTPTA